jgi:hypothetical protein
MNLEGGVRGLFSHGPTIVGTGSGTPRGTRATQCPGV